MKRFSSRLVLPLPRRVSGPFRCRRDKEAVLLSLFEVYNAGVLRHSYLLDDRFDSHLSGPETYYQQDFIAGDLRFVADADDEVGEIRIAEPRGQQLRIHSDSFEPLARMLSAAFGAAIAITRFLDDNRVALGFSADSPRGRDLLIREFGSDLYG